MKECTCPVEHTVAKLGHCRTCDAYELSKRTEREMDEYKIRVAAAYLAIEDSNVFSFMECGGKCPASGGQHNFDWATYADDVCTYGVCSCGITHMDVAMMEAV